MSRQGKTRREYCRIVKGLDDVWAHFCPSKPCLPLLTDGKDGIDYYLFLHHTLSNHYITKEEARSFKWSPAKGNLWDVLPGTIIGGSIYKNKDGRLPNAPWRVWYEADFDYQGGYRNNRRIVFSNDGLMFVTYDHYLTFSEIYWEDDYDDLYH